MNRIVLFVTIFLTIHTDAFSQSKSDSIWNTSRKYLSEKNFPSAISGFTELINEIKNPPDSLYLARANAYFLAADMHRAFQDAKKSISANKKNSEAHFLVGLIKSHEENYSGAIRSFNKAIKLSPDIPKYYYDRGIAYLREEDIDDAITDFDKVISMKSDYAHAYFSRGYAKDLLGKTDEAISDINKSIELEPTYKQAYLELALIYLKRKEISKSCSEMERAAKNGCTVPEDIKKKYCQ